MLTLSLSNLIRLVEDDKYSRVIQGEKWVGKDAAGGGPNWPGRGLAACVAAGCTNGWRGAALQLAVRHPLDLPELSQFHRHDTPRLVTPHPPSLSRPLFATGAEVSSHWDFQDPKSWDDSGNAAAGAMTSFEAFNSIERQGAKLSFEGM